MASQSEHWPVVSVIIATHQRPKLLNRALKSVLRQNLQVPFEVLIIHDGPPEAATLRVVSDLAARFEKRNIDLGLLATKEESGYFTQPRNWATMHARGDYIANLDDDNEWEPSHLSTLLAAIEEGEEWPDFVYSRRRYVIDAGSAKDFHGTPLPVGPSPLVPWDDRARARLASSALANFIDSGDFLIARGALYWLATTTQMMWNEGVRRFGDYELLCRGVFFGGWRGKAVDAVTHIYHWHDANVSKTRPVQETPTEKRV